MKKGTRSTLGLPGPNYWQQRAKYRITAALTHGGREVAGQETVTYFNYSPDTLNGLVVQLYQNLHTASGVAGTALSVTGGVHLDRVVAGGVRLENHRDLGSAPAYRVDGTIARLSLPRPLRPGDSLDLEFVWRFTLPMRDQRMGTDGQVSMIGYWYPQLAVYDDVIGWDTDQYTGRAEFYMGYADYDVELEVPSGWLVGATGELMNARSVLGDSVLDRLGESRRAQRVTHIVTEQERGAGRATHVGENGVLRWHFTAKQTRDFAWVASDRYLWDATSVVVPSSSGANTLDTVNVNTLYRPSAKAWAFAAGFAARVLELYTHYLWPYPYSQLTVAEGPWGGMEYPMFTVIYPYKDTLGLFSVEAHEIGHMWFPMQVGSNEKRSPWQDEGLTQFNGDQAIRVLIRPPTDPELSEVEAYCNAAKRHVEVEMREHGDNYPRGPSYGVASYAKPVAMLRALRAILGDSVF
ncbi:MAG TPA: M1 family metallopeptidase, partial [bacterium]|nr:M1 family metallopeptidase [bacterium]